jgi:hypothetical protein
MNERSEPALELDAPGTAGLRRQLDVTCGARWRDGNVVTRTPSEEAIIEFAAAARRSVLVVLGRGWPPKLREQVALACAARAGAGVDCLALVKPMAVERPYVGRLRSEGCDVQSLDHADVADTPSLLVVDATRGIVGDVELAGPLVRDLVAAFQRCWPLGLLPGEYMPALDASGHARVAIVTGATSVERALDLVRASARRGVLADRPGVLVADQQLALVQLQPAVALLVDDRASATQLGTS